MSQHVPIRPEGATSGVEARKKANPVTDAMAPRGRSRATSNAVAPTSAQSTAWTPSPTDSPCEPIAGAVDATATAATAAAAAANRDLRRLEKRTTPSPEIVRGNDTISAPAFARARRALES
jgi:hypothetical protein